MGPRQDDVAYDLPMAKPIPAPVAKRRRGNPNWGQTLHVPALVTEFEKEVARLGLRKSQYVVSPELKSWCNRKRNHVYVPEWLLAEWGMKVEMSFGAR